MSRESAYSQMLCQDKINKHLWSKSAIIISISKGSVRYTAGRQTGRQAGGQAGRWLRWMVFKIEAVREVG